jgi:hypothetical protein
MGKTPEFWVCAIASGGRGAMFGNPAYNYTVCFPLLVTASIEARRPLMDSGLSHVGVFGIS